MTLDDVVMQLVAIHGTLRIIALEIFFFATWAILRHVGKRKR